MVDKVRSLKLEDTSNGSSLDMFPNEKDPQFDYSSVKGIAFENSDDTIAFGDAGVMKFKDTEVTTAATLKDAVERLRYKDVDLTALTNGYVLTWNNSLNTFELSAPGSASNGVTPPFFMSKAGNAAVGTYLRVGEAVSSNTGMTIVGDNSINKLVISNGNNVASNTVVQIQRRTAVNTFSDITGASITIPAGTYKASLDGLSITLNTDEEISAYVKSGSTLSNAVFGIYIVPV
jgi:hypothetical protein